MKLFIRDHLVLILLQPLQWGLVIGIYWMDGYRDSLTASYASFLGLFLFSAYLAYRYISLKDYYKRLTHKPANLDEALQPLGNPPVAESLQHLLSHQFRLMQQQLLHAEQQQSTHMMFMNQWVHQMKTPLSIMELAMQSESDAEHAASMREELDRLRQGLDTVLYAARLQAFQQDFHVKTIRLASIIEQVVHDHKRLFIRSYVYPEVVCDTSIHVQSDEKWLAFMLGQLLTNAIKYSAGKHLKVTISAYIEQLADTDGGAGSGANNSAASALSGSPRAIIAITDRGIGIPQVDLKRVFAPFYTGENGRSYRESTGMGLYLVKQACEQLGHQIELESAPGQGTSVRLLMSSWQQIQAEPGSAPN